MSETETVYIPPEHLRPATAVFWLQSCEFFGLEPDESRILTQACSAWDRAELAREALAEFGMTYIDRFGQPRSRPEIAIERDCRLAFLRCIRALNLRQLEEAISRNGGKL